MPGGRATSFCRAICKPWMTTAVVCGQECSPKPENQTAYLRLPADESWWYWYGSEVEANGYYLKLLARREPKGETASGLVK